MGLRLKVLLCLSITGSAMGSGCSSSPPVVSTSSRSSTSESINVSEQVKNGVCTATITVQESANGKKRSAHQADVPCANVNAAQSQLVSQAKQGL